ncbi:RimJ/RimL family protein N-acetyltransferase [Lacibacter cauensis]|uniref:RimJ/RimL family protein N-acetyltransferase n=1 Tax=Lacibacter cauensis TaxID=510947 RepID=A0A562SWW0_9BACT|nr:GNAT family N-acetyltransferase [Lacibacter cauensis]TWI85769.1 RimJ/RimL family protein N-acetyltransferase [Lacibacter cauensis]
MNNFLLDGQETERLFFRAVNRLHYEAWLPFFITPETSRHWIMQAEKPEIACSKWYEKQFNRYERGEGGMNALLDKVSGCLIGHCGLIQQRVDGLIELEVGYSILPAYWNKGYATEAAIRCKTHAFENSFFPSLISIISPSNTASIKVALKMGMILDKTTVYGENNVSIYRVVDN